MSAVKIQVIEDNTNHRTEVLVDNDFAYFTNIHPKIVREQIKALITLLQIDNIEITDARKV